MGEREKAWQRFGVRRQVGRDGAFGWELAVEQGCIVGRRKSGVASDLPPQSKASRRFARRLGARMPVPSAKSVSSVVGMLEFVFIFVPLPAQ
jgi:hypothetical protein